MARWKPWRPTQALAPAPAVPVPATGLLEAEPGWDSPEARREHWGTLAMDLLRDTEVPTTTVLGAYLDRVLT